MFDPATSPNTPAPADGQPGVFFQNFGKFERPGSTFHWIIRRPRLIKLVGYSKPVGQAEKANKQELIQDCIRRLIRKGWSQNGNQIEFYRAFHESDDNQSVKLFTLYANRYIPEPVILLESWLIKFLSNTYSPPVAYYDRAAGLFPTGGKSQPPAGAALIPDPALQADPKDPFDLSRSFNDEKALLNYIDKLGKAGHPHGRIMEYYRVKILPFQPS